MRRLLATLALVTAIGGATSAAAKPAAREFEGQGFDCYFQTSLQKLDRVSVWYGGLKYANDKSPQFADPSRLVVLHETVPNAKAMFYVTDKWPDTFQYQYFEKSSTSPLTMLTIYGEEPSSDSFRAEIIHLPPNMAAGVSTQPTKRIGGMCTYTAAVKLAAFRTQTQP
ncbi:hypothetical protein SAMN05518801_11644 [Novosphingobium sp. CF614]|uniref:hypothetical protein n=1 Tax=Novosphingobium sp. CF614 TaxID=1884364 RepID=UPI0008E1C5AC|nr:hypothetical protein [Novosphingobium sp. CF614]SFG32060.1 hypothetical protein SAMN05518801_11644 [Novosphingobium sp. CF614]